MKNALVNFIAVIVIALSALFPLWCVASLVDTWANLPEVEGEAGEYAGWNFFNLYDK